jgi:hypothetical protein
MQPEAVGCQESVDHQFDDDPRGRLAGLAAQHRDGNEMLGQYGRGGACLNEDSPQRVEDEYLPFSGCVRQGEDDVEAEQLGYG